MTLDKRLQGLRCIGQIRCSRKVQAKNSLPQQRQWLREFSSENEMVYVDDMQEAVSASQIKRRPDLERIFERKRLLNDFDVVVVQDLSRLTRGGAKHGLEVYFRFQRAGLQLVSIVDGLIEGDDKIIEAAQRFQEGRATAKATSMASRRGYLASRAIGRIIYSARIPYGIDRLIRDSKGKAKFILRNLPDGSQVQLSPDGLVEMHHFKHTADGERTHYMKQQDEFEECVPGDNQIVKRINHMFHRFFVEGVKAYSIALELNDKGSLSSSNKPWHLTSIKYILRNPIYLGVGYADRTARGLFWMNSATHPVPVSKCEGPLGPYRDEKNWYKKRYEAIDNLLTLDDATKVQVSEWQAEEHKRLAERRLRNKGGDRHVDSSFFLKGILRSKQGGYPFRGSSQKRLRYYMLSNGRSVPKTNNAMLRSINADALETAVKSIIREVLGSYAGVEAAVISACESCIIAAQTRQADIPKLRAERERLIQQMSYWVNQLSMLGPEVVDLKVEPLKNAVVEVGNRLKNAETSSSQTIPASVIARQVDDALQHVTKIWDTLSPPALHRVLQILVGKLEVDMETLQVNLDLRLPSWAATDDSIRRACLEDGIFRHSVFETYTQWTINLGSFLCKKTDSIKPCFTCSRSSASGKNAA